MPDRNVLFLPGLLCDAALWNYQCEHLSDICTPSVADLTRDGSIAAMAERVLSAAPPRFALVGLSMGGYVAQEIMRQAPDRVDRLALLDTSARADTEAQRRARHDLLELAAIGRFKGVTPRLLPHLVHESRLHDPAVADVVLAMAERIGQEAFRRQQQAIMGRKDGRADLAAIRVPTLIACGRQDRITPAALHQEMAADVVGSKLVIVEDAGHLPPLEQPQAVTALLRYWLA